MYTNRESGVIKMSLAQLPGNKDSIDDHIGCRINNVNGAASPAAKSNLMKDEESSAIRGDLALSGNRSYRDSGNIRQCHGVKNRDGRAFLIFCIGVRVAACALEM